MNKSMKERVYEWDFIKGFLVIMIILGHTTASFGTFEKDYLLSYCSSLTVSFIMPLFLITTGYFLYPKKPLKRWDYYLKKFRRMVFPAVFWGAIGGGITSLILLHKGASFIAIIKNCYWNVQYLWYLYAVFVCALIVFEIERYIDGKNNIYGMVVYIIVSFLMLIIPTDKWNINFSFQFIAVGRLLRKSNFSLHWFQEHKRICIIICMVYFTIVSFFPYEYSVYVSGTNVITNSPFINQISIVLLRFILGVIGSASVAFIVLEAYWICKEKNIFSFLIGTIENMGISCLEIYCIQFIVIERLFKSIIELLAENDIALTQNPYLCYFGWRHLFGLSFCYLVYKIVRILKNGKVGTVLF